MSHFHGRSSRLGVGLVLKLIQAGIKTTAVDLRDPTQRRVTHKPGAKPRFLLLA